MKAWLTKMVITYFIKNYRTTIPGIIAGLINLIPAVGPWLAASGYSKEAITAFLIMVIGFFAKDGGVTNSPTPVQAQAVPSAVIVPNTDPQMPILGG